MPSRVVVNETGEEITLVRVAGGITEREFANDDPLEDVIGFHVSCRGVVVKRDVSRTHFVIFCPNCALRLAVPKVVRTFGELYKHFNLLRGNY